MDIVYPDLPAQVYHDQVLDAIKALGFNPSDVRELCIKRRALEVTLLLSTGEGKRFAAGDEAATCVVRLPITDRVFLKAEDEGTVMDDRASA